MQGRDVLRHPSDQVNILWGLYAMCGMAALLCVEVARPRGEERFTVDERVAFANGGTAVLRDISVSGARLAIDDPPPELTFSWCGVSDVTGRLVRRGPG
jgi:hypothetical protein